MERTQPLTRGTESTGLEVRMGWKENLQPKLKAESLKKEADTIGLEIRIIAKIGKKFTSLTRKSHPEYITRTRSIRYINISFAVKPVKYLGWVNMRDDAPAR